MRNKLKSREIKVRFPSPMTVSPDDLDHVRGRMSFRMELNSPLPPSTRVTTASKGVAGGENQRRSRSRGVGQSYPISLDGRSTTTGQNSPLFAGRTVTWRAVAFVYMYICIRACIYVIQPDHAPRACVRAFQRRSRAVKTGVRSLLTSM